MRSPRDLSSASLRIVNYSRAITINSPAQQLTFQTTIRSLSCSEIADDLELVSRIKQLYDQLDTGTTPSTILLPWLPSWAMAKKLWSTKEIYDIIVDAVKKRQDLLTTISEGERPQDTMQLLLDAGDDRMAVVGVSHPSKSYFLWSAAARRRDPTRTRFLTSIVLVIDRKLTHIMTVHHGFVNCWSTGNWNLR